MVKASEKTSPIRQLFSLCGDFSLALGQLFLIAVNRAVVYQEFDHSLIALVFGDL